MLPNVGPGNIKDADKHNKCSMEKKIAATIALH